MSGVGRPDADAVNFIDCVVCLDEAGSTGIEFIKVILYAIMLGCFDRITCNDDATCVDEAEHGVCATDIDTENVRFHSIQVI